MYLFDANACVDDGFYKDMVDPSNEGRIVDNGPASRCERSGAASAGVWHGSECIWWRDLRPVITAFYGGQYEKGDPAFAFQSFEEMRTSEHISITTATSQRRLQIAEDSPPSSPPASPPSPSPLPLPPPAPRLPNGPDTCDAREHHARSRGGSWGAPNYAQGIGKAFSTEVWLSNIDLKGFLCQTGTRSWEDVCDPNSAHPAMQVPGGPGSETCTYAPGSQLLCYVDSGPQGWAEKWEMINWPRGGHQYSSWPYQHHKWVGGGGEGGHPGGQYVLFALMEPDAVAPWYGGLSDTSRLEVDDQFLNEMCAKGVDSGFGMAMVINHNGCPQLIFNRVKETRHPLDRDTQECYTIPENPEYGINGCYGTAYPDDPSQWVRDGWPTNLDMITFFAEPLFEPMVFRRLFDSIISSPNTPHHFVFSVNDASYATIGEEHVRMAAQGKTENDYAPRWAFYVDGEIAMSSMHIQAAELASYTGPIDSQLMPSTVNAMFNRRAATNAPRLDEIITPTMRLHVGVEGFPQNNWVSNGDPEDPTTHIHVNYPDSRQSALPMARRRNPVMNAHPLNAAFEFVALHGRALTLDEAAAHYAAGLPNRPPLVTTGLTALSVWEDLCEELLLTATDDDVLRYNQDQTISWNVIQTVYPIFTDAACTQEATVDETTVYPALYYKGPFNYNGAYGSFTVRAYDGVAFSSPRSIALSIAAVVDGPVLDNATATIEALGVATFELTGTSPDTTLVDTNAFRLQVVSLPAHGRLFDGDPAAGAMVSGGPLQVGDITTDKIVYYQSQESVVSASIVAQTDTFLLRGVSPSGYSDSVSHVQAGVTVNILSAMRPVTITAAATEDKAFTLELRAFYGGAAANIHFQIVSTTHVTIYQADGSPVVNPLESAPVVLTGAVLDCADDATYKCTIVSGLTADNLIGRRLQAATSSPATFSYQVVAEGVVSEPIAVAISIVNVIDPITGFVCADSHEFSRLSTTVTFPLVNNVNFSDPYTGPGEYVYLRIETTAYEFDVTANAIAGQPYTNPPLTTQFQTYTYQAYDMLGYCPAICVKQSSSEADAQLGFGCNDCLVDTVALTGLTSFRAVMTADLVPHVLDSVRIAMEVQGYIPSFNGSISVFLYKFDNETHGFPNECNFTLFASEEPYFDMYASEGICFFHSSTDLVTRFIYLIVCTWFYWNGPLFWWLRGNPLTGGVITQVLVTLWFVALGIILVLCCCVCVCCASVRFVQYVLVTLKKLRDYLDRDERTRRGARVEMTCPQAFGLYATCYGFCGLCSGICRSRYENDPSPTERVQYALWAYVTCKLIPALKPSDEPVGPTWSEWLWDCLSWFLCRGFGLVPSMRSWRSRNKERAEELDQQRAVARARRNGEPVPNSRNAKGGRQPLLVKSLPSATIALPGPETGLRMERTERIERPTLSLRLSERL